MMSIFDHRKPPGAQAPRNSLEMLRRMLERLDEDPEQTPQMTDLKRILAGRIAELER